ncbi:MAG: carboxy terminal-processing peptidase [Sedimenticola sp.]
MIKNRSRINSAIITLILLLVASPLFASISDEPKTLLEDLVPERWQQQAVLLTNKLLDRHHYKKQPLDDVLASKIFDGYLSALDPERIFFDMDDINRFEIYRYRLDDDLKRAELSSAFDIFNHYRRRVEERVEYAKRLLREPLDFKRDEHYQTNRKESHWVGGKQQLNTLWRKRVKNDILVLRLRGVVEKEIKERLRMRYQRIAQKNRQMGAEGVIGILINAYTHSLDPQTSYTPPAKVAASALSGRRSPAAVGLVLAEGDQYSVVKRAVPGGTAWRSGKVKAGDRIVAIGEGDAGPILDVIGWRLNDVVERIRGEKGSKLRLYLLSEGDSTDAPPREVTLTRDRVDLSDQRANASIVSGIDGLRGHRIGVITIPTFYRDFRGYAKGDREFSSVTTDVRRLLNKLKGEGVSGVVVDLRGNGGGALVEAVELPGLFIPSGPVVQVKNSSGEIEVEKDKDGEVSYAGPLALLVDSGTVSGAEIFAAAIQDHQRGIVIGEPTFGNGTVQTVVDLSSLLSKQTTPLGYLHITVAQFFRINGSSTQIKGVVPDIVFPHEALSDVRGESLRENALPWVKIHATEYTPVGLGSLVFSRLGHEQRLRDDLGLHYLMQKREAKRGQRMTRVSLDEAVRLQGGQSQSSGLAVMEQQYLASAPKPPLSVDIEERSLPKTRDPLQEIMTNEAARILSDYIESTGESGQASLKNISEKADDSGPAQFW